MPCGGCGDNCKCSTNQCCSSCKCDASCTCKKTTQETTDKTKK